MPVRPRIQAVQVKRINPIAYLIGDGTRGFTGDDAMPDEETARQHWPDYRRETWAHQWRGGLPAAAETFDGLTTNGFRIVHAEWQRDPFPLDRALRALSDDRAAVERFRRLDPKGARSIADFLEMFVRHLDHVEATARQMASVPYGPPHWARQYPNLTNGGRYGDPSEARPIEAIH